MSVVCRLLSVVRCLASLISRRSLCTQRDECLARWGKLGMQLQDCIKLACSLIEAAEMLQDETEVVARLR